MSNVQPPGSRPILEIREVTKDFGGVRALDRCAFDVPQGAITGLIGPNGAGKTTLFNLITGFGQCAGGSIWFKGQRIDGLPPHRIVHKGILRTFQLPRELRRMTVLENLMVVPAGQTGEKLWASLILPRRVSREERSVRRRALEVLERLSLRTLANEYAGNLSTGQKKLLELARTLMARPELVLLDEPGAGVNPTLKATLADDIRRSCAEAGITFLVIEHDMNLVMNLCDPIVVMSNGAKLMEGAPAEVRANREVVEAYLGRAGSAG